MIEISEAQMARLSVHTLGNKGKDEGYSATATEFEVYDALENVLIPYFLKGFKEPEFFKFDTEATSHPVRDAAARIFENPECFHLQSAAILKHLYACSEHPSIKPGDLFVVLFEDLVLEGEMTRAVGIFKCEQKERFLKVTDRKNNVLLDLLEGIDLRKTDKACLIFDTEAESGYRVAASDNHRYDAHYWFEDFLSLVPDRNDMYLTRHVINLCRDFAEDVVGPEQDKREQALFMARSLDFLKKNEEVNLGLMAEEVMPKGNEEMRRRFMEYRDENEHLFGDLTDDTPIKVSPTTLQREKKKVKSNIKLDNQIEIKINPDSPEHAARYIEKGYDDLRQLHFYKIYYSHEQ
jgi:hypothetical protein